MGYEQIVNLPYSIFLSLMKHNQMMDLEETPEGRDYLDKLRRLNTTEADLGSLRKLAGYKVERGSET
jgi:hypothetical protein